MKINKNYLLLIAGIFWLIAGFFILKVGIPFFIEILKQKNILIVILSLIFIVFVFAIFYTKIFLKLVNKHTLRIKNNQSFKMQFWKFFDLKSYIIMVFMMTLGILGRKLSIFPKWFIGTFYIGLGFALFLAGVNFIVNFIKKKVL